MATATAPQAASAHRVTGLWQYLIVAGNAMALAAIAVTIELTGGFPSQLAHLYYIPVVLSALTLSRSVSLAIAVGAALLVSPAIDLIHMVFGGPTYFDDPRPWNFTPSGWILRPFAFLAISAVGNLLTSEHWGRVNERLRSESRSEELKALNRIDKMILSGASETKSIEEISRFVIELTGAYIAGISTPNPSNRDLTFRGFYRGVEEPLFDVDQPYGEGVSGWAIMHGRTTSTRDVFSDPRYERLAELAKKRGWRSAAAAAIVLDAEILGALTICYENTRDFTSEELTALERLADQAAIAVASARQREALQRMALDTATVLSNVIETRDAYTAEHSIRLVDYAGLTAAALGLRPKEVEHIKLGAALHDVGKIVVPDHVLKKPDKLTPDEYALIKQHCYVGGQICKKVPFLERVHPMVYHHHEHFDGNGYPDGLAGDLIPIGARIIAVVDAFDAMTRDRPYRRALGFEAAVETLWQGAGSQWDPKIVDLFLAQVVENTGELRVA